MSNYIDNGRNAGTCIGAIAMIFNAKDHSTRTVGDFPPAFILSRITDGETTEGRILHQQFPIAQALLSLWNLNPNASLLWRGHTQQNNSPSEIKLLTAAK